MTSSISPQAATVIAALIAAFVAFMSLLISKEQKVSEFRQAWINSLRDDIAEAISSASALSVILQDHTTRCADTRLREWSRFSAALARIELRLNTKEAVHQSLIECIREAEKIVMALERHDQDYEQSKWINLQDRVVSSSQTLLKIEWERVKEGEPLYSFVKVSLFLILLFSMARAALEVCA